MPLLALIGDRRGREPLVAMLLDRSPRLRGLAARCLGRFPDATCALQRLLLRERDARVRAACVRALVEQYGAGDEDALGPPLRILLDANEPVTLRRCALALVPSLRPVQRRGILARLAEDVEEEIRRAAADLEQRPEPAGDDLAPLIRELGAEEYERWNDALRRLVASGAGVIDPLVGAMRSRAHDPEFCTRAGMVLKRLGPRRTRALAAWLEQVEEPLPLQVLVEVVGALGEKSMIYRLRELVERAGRQDSARRDADGFDPMRRVRAKAHLELARIGSRVAIDDLRRAIDDPEHRIELEMLAAVEQTGNHEEIAPLLRAWLREEPFVRTQIADVVRRILRREKLALDAPVLRQLGDTERRVLESIAPGSRETTPPRRARRRAGGSGRSGPAAGRVVD
jgi:HEAT repeat protein